MTDATIQRAGPPPRVTIVMATWNWSEVLPFSIGSALLQTFTDFELLVVGDGCTDNSAEVVAAIADPRVRWINLPANSGHQSGPNNEGLRQARGELVAYLGHDDLWLPHHLACLVQAIDAGADLVYGMVRFVTPCQDGGGFFIRPDYRSGDWLPPTCVTHRRALAVQAGGWPNYRTLRCDPETELWRRFHEAGAHIGFVPRLTAIKLPAAERRNVYRERPCHEQAAWLERIRSSDVEREELAAGLIAVDTRLNDYRGLLREVVRRGTSALIARLRALRRPRAGEALEQRQRFKGVDRRAGRVNGRPKRGSPQSRNKVDDQGRG
ncbi:MAG TPA: glycosyltransferase [Allosphingosinicella sp.]